MEKGYVRVIGTPIGRLFLNSNSIKYEDSQIKLAYVERYLLLLSNKNVYITMCFGPYTRRENKTEEALIQEWINLLGNKEEAVLAEILKGIFWNDLTDVYSQENNECRTVQVGGTDLYVYLSSIRLLGIPPKACYTLARIGSRSRCTSKVHSA